MRRVSALLLPSALLFCLLVLPGDRDSHSLSVAPASTAPAQDFFLLVKGLWNRLDTAGRGFVTIDDIDRAILEDFSIKGDEAYALFALKRKFGELAATGRLSLKDLTAPAAKLSPALAAVIDADMSHARIFLSQVNRELYPSGSLAQSMAKMHLISQVHRGNCYFQSGFSSCAWLDPAAVRAMISENAPDCNGRRSYTVVFPRAPQEPVTVAEFTEAGLLVNDVEQDSGTWMAVLIRAYGVYQKNHPLLRWPQRWFFELNNKVLPEDITDEGSMFNDGLRMCTGPGTVVKRVIWGMDRGHLEQESGRILIDAIRRIVNHADMAGDSLAPALLDLARLLKSVDEGYIRGEAARRVAGWLEQAMIAFLYLPRDPAVVHRQLKHSIVDHKLPATVIKYGGAHEAAILNYRPGTVSADGKHTSAYGFITVRDQAGLSGEEEEKVKNGTWFREAGMDERTVCMSVEEFTMYYTGFASVIK